MKIEELLDHFVSWFEIINVYDVTTRSGACWSQLDAAGDAEGKEILSEEWEEMIKRITADLDKFIKGYDDYEVIAWKCENGKKNKLWVKVRKK